MTLTVWAPAGQEKIKELQARLLTEQAEKEEVVSRYNMLAHTLQVSLPAS